MSGNQGEAVLKFTIKIDAKLSAESKQTLEEMKNAKMQTTSNNAQPESTEAGTPTKAGKTDIVSSGKLTGFKKDPFFAEPVADEKLKKDVVDMLNKLDTKGIQAIGAFAQNPTNAVFNVMSKILTAAGPEGQALIALIAIAISLPEVLKVIVTALSAKGMPLNRDWQAYLDQQINVGLTRELQKRTELGIDQVILSQFGNQYIPNNPYFTYNSYVNITAKRIDRIGLADRAAGVIAG